MRKLKRKLNSKIFVLALFFVAGVFLICSSSISHLISQSAAHDGAGQMHQEDHGQCTSHGQCEVMDHEMTSIISTNSVLENVVFGLVLTLSIVLLIHQQKQKILGQNYFFAIRDKYGGDTLFCSIRRYFQLGILHSQIYSLK